MTESSPPAFAALTIDVRRGEPTPEELAALIGVVSEAYEREASATLADDSAPTNPWNVTARALRASLPHGIAWGRFAG